MKPQNRETVPALAISRSGKKPQDPETSQILEEMARTGIRLLLREPFYAHILANLNKQIVHPEDEVKTVALAVEDNTYVLFVNPTFWKKLQPSPLLQYGLLKHELLHLILKHPLTLDAKEDRQLVAVAMDLVVNQYLATEHLPPDAILLQHFPELELLPDQSWQHYHQHLTELRAGRLGRLPTSTAQLDKLLTGSEALDRHRPWKSIGQRTPLERDILEGTIEHLIQRALEKTPPDATGQLPGSLRIYLDQMLRPSTPAIDWRRVIRLFAAGSAKTKIRNTIRRPSKRYGAVPGIQVKRMRKLLVAVDTSGSIKAADMQLFFREIHLLWRQGAEIHTVECDAAVQQSYEYRGQTPSFVYGGGGTRFDGPVQYGNQHFMPDGLIYFTDGHAPPPQIRARFPILWVVSPDGLSPQSEAFRKLPGRKVKLKTMKQ